jgi:hypothetical protein
MGKAIPKNSTKMVHFCSMKIMQDVRDFAKKKGLEKKALKEGMRGMFSNF